MQRLTLLLCLVASITACKRAESDASSSQTTAATATPPAPPAAPAIAPTPEQAITVVRAWLDAIGRDDQAAIAAAMAEPVRVTTALSHANHTECREAQLTGARRDQVGPIATCLVDGLRDDVKQLRARVKPAAVTPQSLAPLAADADLFEVARREALPPAPGQVLVTVEHDTADGHSYAFTATVALAAGQPIITAAFVEVELADD